MQTGSMGIIFEACKHSLIEMLPLISVLGGGRAELRFVAYGDYDTPEHVVAVSGPGAEAQAALAATRIHGGGDCPEAVKTALHAVLDEVAAARHDSPCSHIALLFTDAPPHHRDTRSSYIAEERAALGDELFDWMRTAQRMRAEGVFTVTLVPDSRNNDKYFYAALGPIVAIPAHATAADVSAITMAVFLALIGETSPDGDEQLAAYAAPPVLRLLTFPSLDWQVLLGQDENALPKRVGHSVVGDAQAVAAALLCAPVATALGGTLTTLPTLLKRDAAFRGHVVRELSTVMTPEHVAVLRTNAALAKIWRALCPFGRTDAAVRAVVEQFSAAVRNVPEMREWVEESYNMAGEIAAMAARCRGERVFVLDMPSGATAPSRRDALDVLRGAIAPAAAAGLLATLCGAHVLPAADAAVRGYRATLPEDLPDEDLFAALLHLLHPGMLGTRRAAAMTAAFAVAAGVAALAPRAAALLEARRGAWTGADDWDTYPEVFSVQFMLLMRRIPQHLTDAERAFFERLWYVWRMQRTRRVPIGVRMAAPLMGKPMAHPDRRAMCATCGHSRPDSILVGDVCGICLTEGEETGRGAVPPPCAASGHSMMVECRSAACRGRYAVERPALLHIAPKCHYCRAGEVAQLATCATCHARHVLPNHRAAADCVASGAWRCAVCASGADNTALVDALLEELLLENPALLGHLDYSVPLDALDMKLSAVFTADDAAIAPQTPPGAAPPLTWRGADVLNAPDVTANVVAAVRTAAICELCSICCELRALGALGSACGRCDTLICTDCRGRWYSAAPGQCPVEEGRFLCPFCRRAPAPRLAAHCGRRNAPRAVEAAPRGTLLGFCARCRIVRSALAADCAAAAGGAAEIPAVADWLCAECAALDAVAAAALDDEAASSDTSDDASDDGNPDGNHGGVRRLGRRARRRACGFEQPGVKPCPGCGHETMRTGGCGHMTCPLCAAHWCWMCGRAFALDTIYQHMYSVHGGIGL
jgi:hypothetical protein